MDEALKTIIAQGGVLGAIVICLGFYLVKKETAFQAQMKEWQDTRKKEREAWDLTIEARHKEVVEMTKEMTKAMILVSEEMESCKNIIIGCQIQNGKRGA